MSGNRFLLDTNILLYLIGKKIPVDALPEGEFPPFLLSANWKSFLTRQ